MIETIKKQTRSHATPLLPSFPAGPHRQAQIVEDGILHYDKAGYKVIEKFEDNGWDTQRTEAMGERAMRTALFFPPSFNEIAHDSG